MKSVYFFQNATNELTKQSSNVKSLKLELLAKEDHIKEMHEKQAFLFLSIVFGATQWFSCLLTSPLQETMPVFHNRIYFKIMVFCLFVLLKKTLVMIYLFLSYMYWCFVCMYFCLRISDPLELELQTVLNCHVVAGN